MYQIMNTSQKMFLCDFWNVETAHEEALFFSKQYPDDCIAIIEDEMELLEAIYQNGERKC